MGSNREKSNIAITIILNGKKNISHFDGTIIFSPTVQAYRIYILYVETFKTLLFILFFRFYQLIEKGFIKANFPKIKQKGQLYFKILLENINF